MCVCFCKENLPLLESLRIISCIGQDFTHHPIPLVLVIYCNYNIIHSNLYTGAYELHVCVIRIKSSIRLIRLNIHGVNKVMMPTYNTKALFKT